VKTYVLNIGLGDPAEGGTMDWSRRLKLALAWVGTERFPYASVRFRPGNASGEPVLIACVQWAGSAARLLDSITKLCLDIEQDCVAVGRREWDIDSQSDKYDGALVGPRALLFNWDDDLFITWEEACTL
jgi:hypothetical protein